MKSDEREILYAYVDGSDLDDVAPAIRARLDTLLSREPWACEIWLVDQKYSDDGVGGRDLPDWDLGVNVDVESASEAGYHADLVRLYQGLRNIATETGRDFVLGLHGEDCVSTAERLGDAEIVRLLG